MPIFVAVRNGTLLKSDTSPPLVSDKLGHAILEHPNSDVQLIPASVICRDAELPGYSVLNVTRRASCIDQERSVYRQSVDGTFVASYETIIPIPGCLQGRAIARETSLLPYVLVSDGLVEAVRKVRCGGVAFKNLRDLRPWG